MKKKEKESDRERAKRNKYNRDGILFQRFADKKTMSNDNEVTRPKENFHKRQFFTPPFFKS